MKEFVLVVNPLAVKYGWFLVGSLLRCWIAHKGCMFGAVPAQNVLVECRVSQKLILKKCVRLE